MAAAFDDKQLKKVKAKQYVREYGDAATEVMFSAVKLKSPNDRLRVYEWLRKLNELRNDKYEEARLKNEYMQYLKVSLAGDYAILTKPFSTSPPAKLVPLAEIIANKTCDTISDVPRCGAIQPVLCHKSDDNRAFLCVKRTPGNGVLCYLAVAPDSLTLSE